MIEKFNEFAPEEWNKKHTGHFGFNTTTETFCWSCCLCEGYEGPGCIDEQSVGLLGTITNRPEHVMRPYTHTNVKQLSVAWRRTAQPPSPYANPPEWPIPNHKRTKEQHSLKIRPPLGWDGTNPPRPKSTSTETLTPNRLHVKSRGSLSSRHGGNLSPSGGLVNINNSTSLCTNIGGESADQVYVSADLSLHRRESPMKSNKTNVSKAFNSSCLVSMSHHNINSPVGKAVCVGNRRPFVGQGNRMLTRPHTANAASNLRKYTGNYMEWGIDNPSKYIGPLDVLWNTTGSTSHTMYSGPVKKKPNSAPKKK